MREGVIFDEIEAVFSGSVVFLGETGPGVHAFE